MIKRLHEDGKLRNEFLENVCTKVNFEERTLNLTFWVKKRPDEIPKPRKYKDRRNQIHPNKNHAWSGVPEHQVTRNQTRYTKQTGHIYSQVHGDFSWKTGVGTWVLEPTKTQYKRTHLSMAIHHTHGKTTSRGWGNRQNVKNEHHWTTRRRLVFKKSRNRRMAGRHTRERGATTREEDLRNLWSSQEVQNLTHVLKETCAFNQM